MKNVLYYITFILCFSLSSLMVVAQDNGCDSIADSSYDKKFKKADNLSSDGKQKEALEILKNIVEEDENYYKAHYLLGKIYYKRLTKAQYDLAETHLKKCTEICPTYEINSWFWLGEIQYLQGNWIDAEYSLTQYFMYIDIIQSKQEYHVPKSYITKGERYLAESEVLAKEQRIIEQLKANPVPFNPKKVVDISTNENEYYAFISPDNQYAFFTRRTKKSASAYPGASSYNTNENFVETFMFSEKTEDGNYSEGEKMPAPFNIKRNGNQGGASLSIDNKILFFTMCRALSGNIEYTNCDICWSEYINGRWSEIQRLGDHINDEMKWEAQPSIADNGNTVYFASNRDGGFGGTDIWKIIKLEDGSWSEPINLGPTINTEGNEKSPFIHTDSKTLYFSSSNRFMENESHFGHSGIGGYDIFYSRLDKENKWTKAKNIGYPINTDGDDTGFFVSLDGKYGYYASNKIEENSEVFNIYRFQLDTNIRPEKVLFVKGNIKGERSEDISDAKIELKNVYTDEVTKISIDAITGDYIAAVAFESDYILTVKKPDYAYVSQFISHEDTTIQADEVLEIDVEVKEVVVGEAYRLNDINFASNSSVLNNNSKFIINGFIEFLKDNPTYEVAIHGHTDDIGSNANNLILSEERAKVVYNYIIENGISATRLSYKGFGETKFLVANTSEQARAKNRRTEFVIIKK